MRSHSHFVSLKLCSLFILKPLFLCILSGSILEELSHNPVNVNFRCPPAQPKVYPGLISMWLCPGRRCPSRISQSPAVPVLGLPELSNWYLSELWMVGRRASLLGELTKPPQLHNSGRHYTFC